MKSIISVLTLVFSLALLVSVVATANPGSSVLVAQQVLSVPGPNGQQALEDTLNSAGYLLEGLKKDYGDKHIENWDFSLGDINHTSHASLDYESGIWGIGRVHGDVEMNVIPVSCGQGRGYRLDFDTSRSDSRISGSYNRFRIDLCPVQALSNGGVTMTARSYAVEGPSKGLFAGLILKDLKQSIPQIVDELQGMFKAAALKKK